MTALCPSAHAEDLTYRFDARRVLVHGAGPSSGLTAQAARFDTITGTFGFGTDAPLIAETGAPGRIAFAAYATGVLNIDGLDLSSMPGPLVLRVGDGITQHDAPQTTIKDNLILGFEGAAEESVSLELRYKTAEVLHAVAIPSSLMESDIASAHLTVSTRQPPGGSPRNGSDASGSGKPMFVRFEITAIQAVP